VWGVCGSEGGVVLYDCLLAKSVKTPEAPRESETLNGHVLAVLGAARSIVDAVGADCLDSLGLTASIDREVLRNALLKAALLHDLGKANSHFQRAVRSRTARQALRHEWVSSWLVMRFPDLDAWLFQGDSAVVRFASLCAVLGHHLKVQDGSAIEARDGSGEVVMKVYGDHPDFRSCLEIGTESLGLPKAPSVHDEAVDLLGRPLGQLRSWFPEAADQHSALTAEEGRFVALVKAMLVAADVIGSALPKHGLDPSDWAKTVLERVCEAHDLREVAARRLGKHAPRAFQREAAASQADAVFIKAGCGSGKTVAAYLWAAKHGSAKKLFVCYPTTGTATEGFRDYVIPSEMVPDAALLHSRSSVDLEDLLGGPEDEASLRAAALDTLAGLDAPLAICTADRVLGLIQNGRTGLCSSPALGRAAFVFDEIHQYDDRLFGALLRFLGAFSTSPVLLMTASLPENRLTVLRDTLASSGRDLHVIEGPRDLEGIERYRLAPPVKGPPWDVIERNLADSKKVLWVSNTVWRATSFAKEATRRGLRPVLAYHSRFRYEDRLKRHNAVIHAFQHQQEPVLAVTTQVCEVSLDISADLLVSDLAPVPALIQRLGRLNRRVVADAPVVPGEAVFLVPASELPYGSDQFSIGEVTSWVNALSGRPVSQADLAAAFEKGAPTEVPSSCESQWLDGGPFSMAAPLREAGGSFPVVRECDAPSCVDKKGRVIREALIRCSIPMPLGPVAREYGGWKRIRSSFVAPAERLKYSKEWGAEWLNR